MYLQIRRSILERIERGDYPAGTAIPSENDLAEEFSTTRLTIRNAIDDLVTHGLVRRVQGKGAFVTGSWTEGESEGDLEYGGFREMVKSSNAIPSVRILTRSHRLSGPFYANLFGIRDDDVLYSVRRLNSVNDEPVSIENTLIPLRFFEGIDAVDISVFSLYETYEMYGRKVALAQEKIDIASLSARDAGLLQVEAGSPALVLECVSYDASGQAVECARALNRGDRGGYVYRY